MLSNHFITKCIPGKGWRGMQRWLCMVAVLIVGWLQFAQPANAQPVITRVEYFIDNDPGFGNATALTISSGTDLQNLSIPINPTSLSQGVHTLFARARSANGWGLSNKWIFYKPFNAGSGGTAPNITRVEYFIDTDPGFGNATALTITPGTDLQNLTIPVNPMAMTQGVHTLYARARSANGWSLVNKWIFYKPFNAGSGGTAADISRVEYFIDTDPGLGNATAVTITPGTDLQNLTIPINPATLTEGVHTLFARARSANGWGLVNKWIFYKPFSSNATLPPPNLVALEYYIDADPGLGNGNPVSITNQQDLASLPVAVNISTLAAGDHQLHVRAKDANGNWSLVNTLDFTTNPGVPGNSVVVSSIDKTTFCSSETLKVSYDANGTFTGANTFKVFLSNASGSFTSEREIGSVTTTITSGIIDCTLPVDITAGTGYKVRIKSSSPVTTGPANASAITISQAAVPSVSISSNLGAGVCAGSNITFTATPTNGGVSPTYVWQVNGTDVGTGPSYQSTTLSAGDVVTAVLTSSVACVSSPTATSNAITVSFANVTPTVSISADPGTTVCAGSNVTFTATSTNGGTSPQYAWFINNVLYTYGVSFSITMLANGDVVKCELTSNIACAVPTTVTSNTLTFVVQTGVTYYLDADGDGYGNINAPLSSCAQPAGYVTNSTDCNDGNAAINPTTVWYADADNDGYSNGTNVTQCARPTGYKYAGELFATSGDCNDANAAINPGVSEVCGNGVDDNCNGQIDEACNTYTWYRDNDGDGFGDLNTTTTTTVNIAPAGYVANSTDCDDNNSDINAQYSFFRDNDGDGFGVPGSISVCAEDATTPPSGYATNSTDCDDNNADIHAQYSFFRDNDGDGFGVPGSISVCAEDATTPPSGYATNSTDCDDNNSQIHAQYPFYVDNDADGYGGGNSVLICAVNAAAVPAGYSASGGDCNDASAAINPTTVWYKDADNDGFSDGSILTQCTAPASYKLASALTATSGDCNDANAAINPAATEICGNGIDDNCNGLTDENCETFTWFQDADGDGYGNPSVSTTTPTNTAPAGYVANNLDCNDASARINPTTVWFKDADGDGYSDGSTLTQCAIPTGYQIDTALTATSGDCNDANAAINPGATEICGNGIDENCNGQVDENCETFTWFRDADGDGYGNPSVTTTTPTNTAPAGYVSNNTDCDDSNADYNPAAIWHKDVDDDGYGDGATLVQCLPPSGYKPAAYLTALTGDCNDDDPLLNPATVWYRDIDLDGYSDGTSITQCQKPGPFGSNVYKMAGSLIATSGDCNDENPAIHPDASEVCGNGVDDNCNGQVDEECEIYTYYQDADGDGYGNPAISVTTPGGDIAPPGYVSIAGDCDDTNANINPAATEICGNNVDENCNGQIDENCQSDFTWYQDLDADGYGNPAVTTTTPTNTAPAGYVSNNADCDDNNAAINPTTVWYKDADNDGYSNGSTLTQCTQPASYKLASTLLATSGDCNDANAAINPAATEICGNGVDDNCNGQIDENCTTDPCGGVIGVLYVNAAAVSSGTGSGWACAIQQLRDAVVIANSNPSITQIWVAKGEYKTTSGTDRAATINITRAGLQILGGFAGTETSATQANPTTNVTSISGDIGVAGNKADNSFHLLRIADLPASASGLRIQGFLLEKGNANLGDPNTSENVYGGAVIVKDVNPATSVLFNQCLFNANSSQIAGGAIALYNTSSIQVENAAFWDNSSGYGGAVVSYNSSPSFTKTIFKTNKATTNGGAVLALQGSTTFSKSGFDRNSSGQLGGAVYQEQANTVVSQVVFTGNTAGKSGGAIYQLQANSQVLNSTLFGNTASVSGGAIALATASSTTAQNSIFWKNKQASQTNVAGADIAALSGSGSITAQYNILQPGSSVPADNGGTISNNLRGTDPMFTNEALPAGPDGWLGYGTDGLELKPASPAINAGSNALASSLLTDAKENARIVCSTIDLGPVEYQNCTGLITKADPRLPKAVTVTGIKASVTNPFSSQLLIRYTGADKAEADISSLSGQKMWKGTVINKGQTQVNTATWASGLYQVTIRSNNGQPMVFKVVKVR